MGGLIVSLYLTEVQRTSRARCSADLR
jgi:hypothetical protein